MTILKTFVNGSKIPLIPPLQVDNKLVTNVLNKANLFNNFSLNNELLYLTTAQFL